jgi:hypothetical protein
MRITGNDAIYKFTCIGYSRPFGFSGTEQDYVGPMYVCSIQVYNGRHMHQSAAILGYSHRSLALYMAAKQCEARSRGASCLITVF